MLLACRIRDDFFATCRSGINVSGIGARDDTRDGYWLKGCDRYSSACSPGWRGYPFHVCSSFAGQQA